MRSVKTTFTILEAVGEHQPVGLSDLARRLDLPKSTVQRSLATLAELNWIRTDGRDSTKWRLGERIRALSERVEDYGTLRGCALPFLTQLNSETSETVHLTVFDRDHMQLIERMDSKHPLRFVQPIGSQSALHASSTGKSVLSRLPDSEVEALLADTLQPLTSHTIVDPAALSADLKETRERGYAIAAEELVEGIMSVGGCITGDDGRPFAAVSVSGPALRMRPHLATYGRLVAKAALKISAALPD
ncbi:IclR family transcriptional regulator [Nocardia carnea]|uniref:IclR family transcriptional regulator n=1 Tax=Nocardia carnea TaxID=37328 RepID=UPI00245777B0|nr:IclR family transcriptional regulator [Nocardia carnea]